MSTTNYALRIVIDFSLLCIVALPILIYYLVGVPFQRGFYCDDDSIRYPYKDSTVSSVVLYLIGTFVPVVFMCIIEFVRVKREPVGKKLILFNRNVHPWFWAIYCSVGVFLFGCATSHLITDIAKYSIGRLRPHFIDICKPDWSKINCNASNYIDPIPCTAEPSHRLKEGRVSFPSGHASFSSFTMVYLVIYLQRRLHFGFSRLLNAFIQVCCLLFCFFTALSRISDYKHHWSDVLAGFINGTLTAILISWFVSDLFTKKSTSKGEPVVNDYRSDGIENGNGP